MSAPIEKVVLLGERKALVGVVTQPAESPKDPLPAIIVLNSGIIHRVGHNRMYVALARELAERGHIVLRVDLSGIGDSDSRPDIVDPLEASLADIRDATDWLFSARGVERTILLGLCSGANQSVIYAGRDPRISGAVLLDPTIPRTPRFYVNFVSSRLLNRQYWRSFFLGRASIWKRFARSNAGTDDGADLPPQPSLNDPQVRAGLERAYAQAIANRSQILAIFTGGMNDQHNYRGQLLDAMPSVPFGDQLLLEYFDRCDHTFSSTADRRRLFDRVQTWLATTRFSGGTSNVHGGGTA